MVAKHQESQTRREFCENCAQETPHHVSIEIREESPKKENTEFSREPYRIVTCQTCNKTTHQRMNNA
ncbi:hypothetical protein DMJ13_23365 [halophilic archaeon]|nr:hypothetical protein DMJ13_23365 [halophilic archaeon]